MTLRSLATVFTLTLTILLAAGCRGLSEPECSDARVFRDTLGGEEERERIAVQWVMVRGSLDSMLATRTGAHAWERAARSLEENAGRYADSVGVDGNGAFVGDGCVDWNATWADSRMDRSAMATAMARALLDSSTTVLEFDLDTAARPGFLELQVLGADHAQRTVRVLLDSLRARLVP